MMKLHATPSTPWKLAQWAALRIVIIVLPIVVDLVLQVYFYFTPLQAIATSALIGLVALLMVKARRPSERSEPL
jgi:hypothetical protein